MTKSDSEQISHSPIILATSPLPLPVEPTVISEPLQTTEVAQNTVTSMEMEPEDMGTQNPEMPATPPFLYRYPGSQTNPLRDRTVTNDP